MNKVSIVTPAFVEKGLKEQMTEQIWKMQQQRGPSPAPSDQAHIQVHIRLENGHTSATAQTSSFAAPRMPSLFHFQASFPRCVPNVLPIHPSIPPSVPLMPEHVKPHTMPCQNEEKKTVRRHRLEGYINNSVRTESGQRKGAL